MNLQQLKTLFIALGCDRFFVKYLAPNDNSKNQVYFGEGFEVLNIFPVTEIKADSSGERKTQTFKAQVDFSWLDETGKLFPAPRAQFILYPEYPEVRFSGFLFGCENAPSSLMGSASRVLNRVLFLAVTESGKVIGYVVSPDSELAGEISALSPTRVLGVFRLFELPKAINNKEKLLNELRRIALKGEIRSKRLGRDGTLEPCESSNCGGYTLEAELGIIPNGYSEPDYLGWELKQYSVTSFASTAGCPITLMTPEPTGGVYKDEGLTAFMSRYGYDDVSGKLDRRNFGGVHKYGKIQERTGLELILNGYDSEKGLITNTNGFLGLIDKTGNLAASWDYPSLLKHWNRKHNQACFIPSVKTTTPDRKYQYGSKVMLAEGTDFILLLKEVASGSVYYDPGIKIENMSTKPVSKKRSQFRVNSKLLRKLYHKAEEIDLNKI